jgi:putative lipoprotein
MASGNTQSDVKQAAVTGSVAYRERMALPADAVVEVRLSDVSRQDVAAPVIAETTVMPAGRRIPIPFELRYDPVKIEPKRTYALRATISSAGRMMFTTTNSYPVITRGNPTKVNLMLERVAAGPNSGSRPR